MPSTGVSIPWPAHSGRRRSIRAADTGVDVGRILALSSVRNSAVQRHPARRGGGLMSSIRKFTLACAAVLAMLPMTAMAQGLPNQDTYFTFSQAVELPGKTLPAGTYLFVLADSMSNRHIVRVMSKDRKQVQTTLFAIPS